MNLKLFQGLQSSAKDIVCIASFLLLGLVFSRFGYFDYGDIGLAFLQNDMLLLLAKENGSSFVDLIKVIEPSYYFPSLYQHTFNYSLSVAVVHFISRIVGFSSANIAYVAMGVYFLTLLAVYFFGKILINREYGLLFALLMAVSPMFNVATRTGAGIFYYTHVFYASCLLFFILAHSTRLSFRVRGLCLTFCATGVSLALFNGYPLAFIAILILVVFFILFFLAKLVQKFFPFEDQFLNKYCLQGIGSYVYLIFIGVLVFFGISLTWDLYTGGDFFSTYKRTIGGTLARQANLDVGWEEYARRIQNIFYVLFVDSDKNGMFAYGGVHSDTAFPGKPYIPYFLAPFFVYGLFVCLRKSNFIRIFLVVQFLMFIYVLLFHFQGWAPRVWFPMTFFVLMIAVEGFRETARLYRERFNHFFVWTGQSILMGVFVIDGYSAVNEFVFEKGGVKGFNQGQMKIVRYLEEQELGSKNLVILVGDASKYGWLRHIYTNSKSRYKVIIESDDKEIFEKDKLNALGKIFDSIYVVAQSKFYLMGDFGANFACLHCPSYREGILKKFPTWMPEKVIYSESNRPLHYILNAKDFSKEISRKAFISRDKNTYIYKAHKNEDQLYTSSSLRRSESFKHTGNYSAELKKGQGELISYSSGAQIAAGLNNKRIEFGAWIKVLGSDLATMQLSVLYDDGTKEIISSSFSKNNSRFHPGDGQWHEAKIRKHFQKKPQGLLLKIIFSGLKGSAYIDDVSVSIEGLSMPEMIPNSSFERWDPSDSVKNDFYETSISLDLDKPKEIVTKKMGPVVRMLPLGWNEGGDPLIFGRETIDKAEGKYSLMLSGGKTGVSNISQAISSKYFSLLGGKEVEFKALVRAKKASTFRLQVGLLFSDDKYQAVYSRYHPGDDKWHEVVARVKIKQNLKSLSLALMNGGMGKDIVFIDQVKTELDQKPRFDLLTNNGFEKWNMLQEEKRVKKTENIFKMLTVNSFLQDKKAERDLSLKRIHLLGAVHEIKVSDGRNETVLPIQLSGNMSAELGPEKTEVLFKPFIPNIGANILKLKNMKVASGYGENFLQMDKGSEAELVFRFDFPFIIKQADIFSNPSLFNDMSKANSLAISYSKNGKDYVEIQKIKSNGNERYWRRSHPGVGGDHGESTRKGKDEYTTFNVVYPNSKSLFIKYNLKNKYHMYRNSYLFFSHPEPWFRFVLDGNFFFKTHFTGVAKNLEFISKEGKPATVYLVFKEADSLS